MNKLNKLKEILQVANKDYEIKLKEIYDKFNDSKDYGEREIKEAVTHGIVLQNLLEVTQSILGFLEDDEEEKIKIKKTVKGFDAYRREREFCVEVIKDETGTSITIDNCTIPLEPLGLEIIEKEDNEEIEEFIKDIDEKARLYKTKGINGNQYILKVLVGEEYLKLFECEEKDGEPKGMIDCYKSIRELV